MARGIAAGRLRHRIVIQQDTPSQSATGHPTPSLSTLATVWAARRAVSARERLSAGGEQAVADFVFLIRYRSDVTAKMFILFEGVTYDIVGVIPYGEANVGLELMARRRVD